MKKFLLACLVCGCLFSILSFSAIAAPSGALDSMPFESGENEGIFSLFLEQMQSRVHAYSTACAGSPLLRNFSYIISTLVLLFVAVLSYRIFRPFTYAYGGILGFVFGFSICGMIDGPEWLLEAAPFFNWAFAILFAAGCVVLAIFLSRFAMALFMATSLATVMALFVNNSALLRLTWIISLILFIFVMKSFFIPITSIAASVCLSALFFGNAGLVSLTAWGEQLGFQGGAQPWLVIAVLLSVIFIAIQSKICRGTRYY